MEEEEEEEDLRVWVVVWMCRSSEVLRDKAMDSFEESNLNFIS